MDKIIPILFVTGILLINVSVYLYSIPLGILISGVSLVVISLLIEHEVKTYKPI